MPSTTKNTKKRAPRKKVASKKKAARPSYRTEISEDGVIELKVKPLSVNNAYTGRRFKTQEYKTFCEKMGLRLPAAKSMTVPESGGLQIDFVFGMHNVNAADVDNPVKTAMDCISKKYGFNDNRVLRLTTEKVPVKKDDAEFIRFRISSYGAKVAPLTAEDGTEYVTVKQMAELVGFTIHTVYMHIRSGKIPATKVGGRYRIKKEVAKDIIDNLTYPEPPKQ